MSTGSSSSVMQPAESITDDANSELRAANTFLRHLGFPDATDHNAGHTSELLKLLADACDVVNPDSDGAEEDARQLATQLARMAEHIRKRATDG